MDSNSNGSQQQVVVVGSSFAGLTAALELRKHLDRQHRVVVLDRRPDFTFIPSLVWLPFGKRRPEDITFPSRGHHLPSPRSHSTCPGKPETLRMRPTRPLRARVAGQQARCLRRTWKGIAWVVELTLRAGLQPQKPESHRSATVPRRGA
jgi:hypothetical protein